MTFTATAGVSTPTSDGSGYGPAGGKVFYDKGDYAGGWRYLEAAPKDQATSEWSNITTTVLKDAARGYAIGTGHANTIAIVGQAGCTLGAAKTCDSLSLGGYDDWFLPSEDELDAMYGDGGSMKVAIGGFSTAFYWSSSEVYNTQALCKRFNDGYKYYYDKTSYRFRVRAVRAF